MIGSRDIPIDSNVYLYSGNISHFFTLHDVYRPAPNLQLRQGRDMRALWLIRSFLPQADDLRCLEPHTWPPALTGGQAGVEDRPERGGDQGHLRDRTSFLSDRAGWSDPAQRPGVEGGRAQAGHCPPVLWRCLERAPGGNKLLLLYGEALTGSQLSVTSHIFSSGWVSGL